MTIEEDCYGLEYSVKKGVHIFTSNLAPYKGICVVCPSLDTTVVELVYQIAIIQKHQLNDQ